MLDRLFLSKLNSTGKKAYWIGQISLIAIWAFVVFAIMGMSLDDGGETVLILGILGLVVTWGVVCLVIWPISKEVDSDEDEVASSGSMDQVKTVQEEVRG